MDLVLLKQPSAPAVQFQAESDAAQMTSLEPRIDIDASAPAFQSVEEAKSDVTDISDHFAQGQSFLSTYWTEGHPSALAGAITSFRSALSQAGKDSLEKIKAQIGLADALRLEIDEGTGDDERDRESLALAEEAVRSAVSYPGLYPESVRALAEVLFDRSHEKTTERLQLAVNTFRQLVDLTSDSRSDVVVKSLALHAQSLNAQWVLTRDLKAMELANSTVDRAWSISKDYGLMTDPDLGFAFMMARKWKAQVTGNIDNITEAIDAGEQLIRSCPPGYPLLAKFWICVGGLYRDKASLQGDPGGYGEQYMHAQSEAMKRMGPGHSSWHVCNGNYATALVNRFISQSNLDDLDEAIAITRAVVSRMAGTGYKHHASYGYLLNLADFLCRRYAQVGDLDALDEAVTLQLDWRDNVAPNARNMSLQGLGQAYHTRYTAHGRISDLESAISFQEQCLLASGGPYFNFIYGSNDLARSLLDRFDHFGHLEDIDRAMSVLRAAIERPHPGYKGSAYSLLGQALLKKGMIGPNLQDVEESIRCHHTALDLFPQAHSERSVCYHHLGIAEYHVFLIDQRMSAIQNSIDAAGHALSIMPPDHPTRASYLSSLVTYQLAAARTSAPEALSDILRLLEEAANHAQSWPADRYAAAALWARTSHRAGLLERALEAYRLAISLLPQVAWLGLEDELRVQRLSHQPPDLSQDAAACAIELGLYDLAVEIIDGSRSILWNTSQELRAEVGKLREVAPDLARELAQTNAALAFRPGAEQDEQDERHIESERRRIHRLASRRTELLQLVRSIPGFQNFLVPPSYDALRHASRNGPAVILISSAYRCDALVLQADRDVALAPLPKVTRHVVLAQVDLLQHALRSARDQKGRQFLDHVLLAVLRCLWDQIGKPVWLSLAPNLTAYPLPRLWWCPTGAMTMLPIHACGPYNGMDPNMTELVVSSYIPTLSALLRSQDKADSGPISSPPEVLVISQPSLPNQPALPCALEEARVLSALMPSLCTFLIGPKGTVVRVKDMLRHYTWLHVASHGSQDSTKPLESSIALYDGALKLSELAQERIPNAEFAYLSACHSAKGMQGLPDEAMHLAAGMMFAGFKSVVATSWAIADKDSPVVAEAFYRYLIREGTVPKVTETAEALQFAVKQLRKSGVALSRWVPFVHLGA